MSSSLNDVPVRTGPGQGSDTGRSAFIARSCHWDVIPAHASPHPVLLPPPPGSALRASPELEEATTFTPAWSCWDARARRVPLRPPPRRLQERGRGPLLPPPRRLPLGAPFQGRELHWLSDHGPPGPLCVSQGPGRVPPDVAGEKRDHRQPHLLPTHGVQQRLWSPRAASPGSAPAASFACDLVTGFCSQAPRRQWPHRGLLRGTHADWETRGFSCPWHVAGARSVLM